MNLKMHNIRPALLIALPISLLLVGCDDKKNSSVDLPAVSSSTNAAVVDANNSGKNVRDRDNATTTPGDQSGAPDDIKTTQAIRQALASGTNNYSLTARNVKIITSNKKVILRGPVRTAEEKAGIVAIAKNVAGEGNVEDQLEVEAKP
jgi:hyperosmotically inducible periplasmic protein